MCQIILSRQQNTPPDLKILLSRLQKAALGGNAGRIPSSIKDQKTYRPIYQIVNIMGSGGRKVLRKGRVVQHQL